MATPKPQFRPKLQPVSIPTSRPDSPFKKVLSAPAKSRKASANKRITGCIHVLKGAVWCAECARTFRTQARETYARALRESQRGDVIRAAQSVLVKALKEYALTNDGIAELEREYARLISVGDQSEALKITAQLAVLRREISERNISSRKGEEIRKARITTANSHSESHSKKFISAPLSDSKVRTTAGVTYSFTYHTKERMELRSISEGEVDSAFHGFISVTPMGSGKWSVSGKNGVTLYGFFEKGAKEQMNFVITTAFRPTADSKEED